MVLVGIGIWVLLRQNEEYQGQQVYRGQGQGDRGKWVQPWDAVCTF